MVQRSMRLDFATGMLVFPGGRVDRADADRRMRRQARNTRGLSANDLAYRFAAIRELFEETGLLMAYANGRRRPLPEPRRRLIAERYRGAVHSGQMTLPRLLSRTGLEVDPGGLVPFSHWITPSLVPKRFDTRFYLGVAPAGQTAVEDGAESVRLGWYNPRTLLARWEKRQQPLMFPTRLNLLKLSWANSTAEALAQARRHPVVPVEPTYDDDGRRKRLFIPAEAGYGVTEASHLDADHP